MNNKQSIPGACFVTRGEERKPVQTGRTMEDRILSEINGESYELLIQAAIVQACEEYCEAWVDWKLHPGIKEYNDRRLDALAYFYTDDFELLCDLDPGYLLTELNRKATAMLAKKKAVAMLAKKAGQPQTEKSDDDAVRNGTEA